MERFIIQKSENHGKWVCTDRINGIVCVFENEKFNDTQQFTHIECITEPNAIALAKLANEMVDWLREHHYCKVLPCDARLRVGRRIAELRTKKGYSLMKLAELSGLDAGNISRIEQGKYSTGIDLLGKLAAALRCEIDFIEKLDDI